MIFLFHSVDKLIKIDESRFILVASSQNGCSFPLFTQTSTCPIAPRSPKNPAFVWSVWTRSAFARFSRILSEINGNAGSNPMQFTTKLKKALISIKFSSNSPIIFLTRKCNRFVRCPQICAPMEWPTRVMLSAGTPASCNWFMYEAMQ